jgi:adenosylmethionine-8-amino-7-oxononanoate aminotransferase
MALTASNLIQRDLQHVWHPCSQMKDYEMFKPLVVARARGSYIELSNGKRVIDAISSWWCKTLGHHHPRLKMALQRQLNQFEHVILANTTNETIVKLSEKLATLTHSLSKSLYASDGSCAVEMALKMSLHSRRLRGEFARTRFIALANGFHGETVGAMSVSDLGMYRTPYQTLLFDPYFIPLVPYVANAQDPLWLDCAMHWERVEKSLAPYADTATALIVEPIVQATAGMKLYSQDFLRRLRQWTQQHHIHLIADECMTGIGRTGKMLACEHAGIEPDFLCLSKGLTSGWLPLSVVLTHDTMYQHFYDDYEAGKSFLHSHTHSGNVLAASVALETLNIMQEERMCERSQTLGKVLLSNMHAIADETQRLHNVRGIGAVVAADIIGDPKQRLGYAVYQKAVELGALLRPLGNTIYWVPPLNMNMETAEELKEITRKALS